MNLQSNNHWNPTMAKEMMQYELRCEVPGHLPIANPRPIENDGGDAIDEGAFCDWIASASAGETLEYHRGYLICDRSGANGVYNIKDQQRISTLARRAWIGAELGLLHLYSERLGESWYRYLAVRSNTTLRLTA
jgi:hypothetical protein